PLAVPSRAATSTAAANRVSPRPGIVQRLPAGGGGDSVPVAGVASVSIMPTRPAAENSSVNCASRNMAAMVARRAAGSLASLVSNAATPAASISPSIHAASSIGRSSPPRPARWSDEGVPLPWPGRSFMTPRLLPG
ncbi:MAG: hypothetical protein ACK56I_07465, partial [bacterium]